MPSSSYARLDLDAYLRRLVDTANASQVAFFDLDRTLISGYSVRAFAWERLRRRGSLGLRRALAQVGIFIGYGLGRLDYHDLLAGNVKRLVGVTGQELARVGEEAFARRIRHWVYREAKDLLATHRRLGHALVMITSATQYQARPIARALGFDACLSTELLVTEGVINGDFAPCFGVGKVEAAREYLAGVSEQAIGSRLDDAYFYSDSADDLALLEAVGNPVAVNPKARLRSVARMRGWPMLSFQQRDLQRNDVSSQHAA